MAYREVQTVGPVDPTLPPYQITYERVEKCIDPDCNATAGHWQSTEQTNGVSTARRISLLGTTLFTILDNLMEKDPEGAPMAARLLHRTLQMSMGLFTDTADHLEEEYAAHEAKRHEASGSFEKRK